MSRSTNVTSARLILNILFYSFWAAQVGSFSPLLAQVITNDSYKIKVIQADGRRIRGFVGEVTDSTFTVNATDEAGELSRHTIGDKTIVLTAIRRAIIKQASRKKARLKGAIAGGVLAGLVVLNNTSKNQSRSSALTDVNLVLVIGVGVLVGTLAGQLIGNTKRVVVRPRGADPETIARSLKLQLEPFSYDYQQRLLKK